MSRSMFYSTLSLVLFAPTLAIGQDFKVITKISTSGTPRSENTTIFYQGIVYDYSQKIVKGTLQPPVEFTVLDPRAGKVKLVDTRRKVKSTVSTDHLARFTAKIQAEGGQEGRDAFFFNPEFGVDFTDEVLTLQSPQMTYRVKTTSARFRSATPAYIEAADWFAQLNATRPTLLPPFPRMKLNQALSQRDRLPSVVGLQLNLKGGRVSVQADHDYRWMIAKADAQMCERIGGYLAAYKDQQFNQFREESLKAAAK